MASMMEGSPRLLAVAVLLKGACCGSSGVAPWPLSWGSSSTPLPLLETLLFSFPSQADLFQGKAEGGTAVQELIKWEQWSDLAEAVQEQVEVKKLLRNKLQRLQERQKGLQEPTAFRRKTVQADETNPSLLQEMVAVRLEEQRASRRHKVTSWLRRLLLFLALLQFAVLILVLLKRDILNWVLPPKLAAAFGSRPARSRFF
ncbi:uncharacterized protein LOC143173411 [Aptenodytes patagonicus]|uniref:uncharacterized protein LOC143173411 n=1 Tax=Aptenodytes patagonicus TaxID=9234 RepID=UPI003FA06883